VAYLFSQAWAWGFLGAVVYALSALIIKYWGDSPDLPNARKIAIGQFFVAIIFGPIAAEGFSSTIMIWVGNHASARAVELAVGLSANYLWPLIVGALGTRVSKHISGGG